MNKEVSGLKSNLNAGHRQRMMTRFARQAYSFEGFMPHEVLETFLFLLLPRVNTNHIAHELLERFGTVGGVLSAPCSELAEVKGISIKTAAKLRLFGEIFKIAAGELNDLPV